MQSTVNIKLSKLKLQLNGVLIMAENIYCVFCHCHRTSGNLFFGKHIKKSKSILNLRENEEIQGGYHRGCYKTFTALGKNIKITQM